MTNKLWLKAGKLIMAAGKAVLCGSCPCVANTCCPTRVGPRQIFRVYLTVSGADTCPCLNGTFEMTFQAGVGGINTFTSGIVNCQSPDPNIYDQLRWVLSCFRDTTGTLYWSLGFACNNPNGSLSPGGITDIDLAPYDPMKCDPFTVSGTGTAGTYSGSNTSYCCGGSAVPSLDWSVSE